MSILTRTVRPRRLAGPSVREVCLLGGPRRSDDWMSGDRVSVSGRVYRIEAIEPCYVHLAADVEDKDDGRGGG